MNTHPQSKQQNAFCQIYLFYLKLQETCSKSSVKTMIIWISFRQTVHKPILLSNTKYKYHNSNCRLKTFLISKLRGCSWNSRIGTCKTISETYSTIYDYIWQTIDKHRILKSLSLERPELQTLIRNIDISIAECLTTPC